MAAGRSTLGIVSRLETLGPTRTLMELLRSP
jgi:hypothetical protein